MFSLKKWCSGDASFMEPPAPAKDISRADALRDKENTLGRGVMASLCISDAGRQIWTVKVSRTMFKRIFAHYGIEITNEERSYGRVRSDFETATCVYELKSESFFTGGTACEKIIGAIDKYVDVPELSGKKVRVVVMGGAILKLAKSTLNLTFEKVEVDSLEIEDRLFQHRLTKTSSEKATRVMRNHQQEAGVDIVRFDDAVFDEVNFDV